MSITKDGVLRAQENVAPQGDGNSKAEARQLTTEAKAFASEGELDKALKYFRKAYGLYPSEKLADRIQRVEKIISEEAEVDENFTTKSTSKLNSTKTSELKRGLRVRTTLRDKLYAHQLEGIQWMYDLRRDKKKGGILADDMGLGKTIQVISYVSSAMEMKEIKHVLLVLPMSLIPNWQREFEQWAPKIKVECFHGGNALTRKSVLRRVQMSSSVCITTYGLVITQSHTLSEGIDGRRFTWDYTILDEGHKIKNPTKTTKHLHSIPSRNRLILTGTPVQNSISDMWALMDWVVQGSLLGTKKTFKSNYEIPIERARQRDASPAQIQLGNKMAESLKQLTDPYILRRTKDMLSNGSWKAREQLSSKQPIFPKLERKNDFVVWVYLTEIQKKIYTDFLSLDSVRELLASHRSPLVQLTVLKKICDHPRLLSTKACLELGLSLNDSIQDDPEEMESCAANRIDNTSNETLIEESGKLQFLMGLLNQLRAEGHRTLVFSASRKMLNIIHKILNSNNYKVMRMDGLITSLAEREKRVALFQQDDSYSVFLLTTQVGGVGLTLTGANRVVIFDPAWNPSTDNQAIDRIYRIGQKSNVMVYRLITCGTVEEKIYRRQVFKGSVIQQNNGECKDPFRYFSSLQLKELFVLDDPASSVTQMQLDELHSHQRVWNDDLRKHVNFLQQLPMFGLSDHDLMFSQNPDDFDYESEMAKNDWNEKVAEAQTALGEESEKCEGGDAELRWGTFDDKNVDKEKVTKKKDTREPVLPIKGLTEGIKLLKLKQPKKRSRSPDARFPDSTNSKLDSQISSSNPSSSLSLKRNRSNENMRNMQETDKHSRKPVDKNARKSTDKNSRKSIYGNSRNSLDKNLRKSTDNNSRTSIENSGQSSTNQKQSIDHSRGLRPAEETHMRQVNEDLILSADSPVVNQSRSNRNVQPPLISDDENDVSIEPTETPGTSFNMPDVIDESADIIDESIRSDDLNSSDDDQSNDDVNADSYDIDESDDDDDGLPSMSRVLTSSRPRNAVLSDSDNGQDSLDEDSNVRRLIERFEQSSNAGGGDIRGAADLDLRNYVFSDDEVDLAEMFQGAAQ